MKRRRPAAGSKDTTVRAAKKAQSDSPAQSQSNRCLVVGVGASAGGFQAFTELLEHLPPDSGMAFVLVQHLDPQHESALTQLLARATEMPVIEVTDNLSVQANQVYVIPPNANLTIDRAVLKLKPREQGRAPHHSIDSFFESLSRDRREAAIGVILSGAATDGTLGLEAIKAEDGITFAQDESARYESMPRSAIAAGCVDFVLSPTKIAEELARIAKHPFVAPWPLDHEESSSSEAQASIGFESVLLQLRNRSGIDFSLYRPNTVGRRLARRMALNRRSTIGEYSQFISSNSAELEELYSDLLIGVTTFFRNPSAFEVLNHKVLPDLIKRSRDKTFRAWVPGCSTGQEPYSIAMTFVECAERCGESVELQLFASDVSDARLENARSGVYSEALVRDLSPQRLRRFFVKEATGYRVVKSLRDMIVFARQNFLTDPPFSRTDLISCRNVLIYVKTDVQRRVLPTLHYALNPGGVLFLGEAESIGPVADLFEPLDKKQKLFAKKPGLTADRFVPHSYTRMQADQFPRVPVHVEQPGSAGDVQRQADRVTIDRYAPPSVLLSSQFKVIQFRGECGPFLKLPTGPPSFDVLKMAREGLMLPLRAALEEARKENAAVRRKSLSIAERGRLRRVSFDVVPVTHLTEQCYLVFFTGAEGEGLGDGHAPPGTPAKDVPDERDVRPGVDELERELAETRACLQSIQEQYEAANEELQSSNEEVTSANEELQSINEELETSKEELESANEELTTVNDEMARRNQELNRANADLQNLQASVSMPILVLTRSLAIRSFTPSAAELFNLLETDIGRPLNNVRHHLEIPDLEELLEEVLDKLAQRDREVQSDEGRWWSLRARPYLTLDNRVDGVVLALVDIDSLKRSESAITAARDYAESIVQSVHDPLLVLDRDLRVLATNQAFFRMFGLAAAEVEGRVIYELNNHEWDDPRIRTLLQDALVRDRAVTDYEVTLKSGDRGWRILMLNAHYLDPADAGLERILLGMRDISMRKRLDAYVADTVEAERRWFGRELHDGIAQELTGIAMLTTMFRKKLVEESSLHVAEVDGLQQMLAKVNEGARKLAKGSFPVDLERGGLLVTLQVLARETQESFGVSCTVESKGATMAKANDSGAIQLFRIAQEAVRNAVRHGKPKRIVIRLEVGRRSTLFTARDDGAGLQSVPGEARGMGVRIMRHRAQMIGAELEVRNHEDGGVIVSCTVPGDLSASSDDGAVSGVLSENRADRR